ncbi:carbamate kinase [Halobacterium hubeiense]|jgi:carbamate kinase|uniref:Carbamate kinase n=2 Tax=Halobacterium TaxID=2239 RepID=A0A0U5GZH2_9EURY|nr:carbamate kinase [Halobacterium hubeiense]CQH44560.1 carbamate kinase [Halobacterium hubeiense]
MRTVVALGGNALAPSGEATIAAQRERIEATADQLRELHEAGHDLVLTHGNGPQVGALLRQQEESDAPERPLDVLVAETQAQLGYLLQQALDERIHASVASVVTQVEVDPEDPAFGEPSKPVGPYLSAEQAGERDFETTDVTTPEGETAHRRVVPSPEPRRILEGERIETLVGDSEPVVCGGGGGVPVTVGDDGIEGVAAVVDKDHTTRLVAERVGADVLVMATDVPCVYADFGTPEQSRIADATAAEMREHLAGGEFGEGSMEPKIQACLDFLDAGGERAVVAGTEDVAAAVRGDAGTQIHPG